MGCDRMMKYSDIGRLILAVFSTVGGFIASLFGGWDASIGTLLIFMASDFILGVIAAGIFRVSKNTENGGLESRAGWKGLCRKFGTLLVILIACRLDILLGTSYIRDAVVICYICNECISILENLALIGVPVPEGIKNALEILKNKEEK